MTKKKYIFIPTLRTLTSTVKPPFKYRFYLFVERKKNLTYRLQVFSRGILSFFFEDGRVSAIPILNNLHNVRMHFCSRVDDLREKWLLFVV